MNEKRAKLMVLVVPVVVLLVGCTPTQNQINQVTALLGTAVAAFGGQQIAANQPIGNSLTAGLPGTGTGQGAPAPFGIGTGVGQNNNTDPFAPQPFTIGTGVNTGSGSAADNAFTLASTSGIPNAKPAQDGRLTLTQYGGPTDGTPDANTRAGLGNRNNQLRSTSLALAPNLIRQYGLRGGEQIFVKTAQGQFFLGTYDDTTGNTAEPNVIDVYDPTDRLGRDSFLSSIPPGGWQLAVGPRAV